MEAGPAKKSLRRASQDGRAQLGRASNTSGAGRAQTPARQRLDWHQTLAAKGAQPLALAHLRYRQQASGAKLVHCVLLDQSASMLRGQKLALAKPEAIVMHPGPMNRGVEIASEVADGAQAVILPQVTFGIAVRMAVMSILAGN